MTSKDDTGCRESSSEEGRPTTAMAAVGSAVTESSPKAPVKGILKKGGKRSKKGVGIATPREGEKTGAIQWDEMNIMMTEHPEGKDYGHMKIDEPKTPYNRAEDSGEEDDEGRKAEFSENLAERVTEVANKPHSSRWEDSSGSEVDPDDLLTEEQREHKRKFREWRKKHYDEFYAVKRARERKKGRRQPGDDDEEDEEEANESMDTATT